MYFIFCVSVSVFILYGIRAGIYLFILLRKNPKIISSQSDQNPSVDVIVCAHNEESVIGDLIKCLLKFEYPNYRIIIVNDRSTDNTQQVVDGFKSNKKVIILNRIHGDMPGKPVSLNDAMRIVKSEIIVLFDADYLPSPDILQKLIKPFTNNKIGAVMGRPVPENASKNICTNIANIERIIGYGVEQNVRNLIGSFVQFGGTVAAVRVSALKDCGGWNVYSLTEDTDLTSRMYIKGWNVVYEDTATCYEECVENFFARARQLKRWSFGHNKCAFNYIGSILKIKNISLWQKIDVVLILCLYMLPIVGLFCIVSFIFVFYNGSLVRHQHAIASLGILLFISNLLSFVQLPVAIQRDKTPHVLKKLHLLQYTILFNIHVAMVAFIGNIASFANAVISKKIKHDKWDKTIRFRR